MSFFKCGCHSGQACVHCRASRGAGHTEPFACGSGCIELGKPQQLVRRRRPYGRQCSEKACSIFVRALLRNGRCLCSIWFAGWQGSWDRSSFETWKAQSSSSEAGSNPTVGPRLSGEGAQAGESGSCPHGTSMWHCLEGEEHPYSEKTEKGWRSQSTATSEFKVSGRLPVVERHQ